MSGDIYRRTASTISTVSTTPEFQQTTARSPTHLINKYPNHIALRALQRAERPTEMELNIVLLALHADPHQDPSLGVELEPFIVREEIPESARIQAEVATTEDVVLPDERAIAHARHHPQGLLY